MPLRASKEEEGLEFASHMGGCEWQQREMPRAFDGQRQLALMASAGTDLAAWANLAEIGQITAQRFAVLVINHFILVLAKDAGAVCGQHKTTLVRLARHRGRVLPTAC